MLVNTPFGEELLHAIGWVYLNKAEQWLGFHDNSFFNFEARAARIGQRSVWERVFCVCGREGENCYCYSFFFVHCSSLKKALQWYLILFSIYLKISHDI
jgi:hypothetical protein